MYLILNQTYLINLSAWLIGYDISSDWYIFAGTSASSGYDEAVVYRLSTFIEHNCRLKS